MNWAFHRNLGPPFSWGGGGEVHKTFRLFAEHFSGRGNLMKSKDGIRSV